MSLGPLYDKTLEPFSKLLRATSWVSAVFGILIYTQINLGSCAPAVPTCFRSLRFERGSNYTDDGKNYEMRHRRRSYRLGIETAQFMLFKH